MEHGVLSMVCTDIDVGSVFDRCTALAETEQGTW